ncbi:hypothetical protein DB30_03041 [Enhygromyxa salina]|uniref:Uncharacterized protein n=1 Tax=Enhygromyxa salina TaxID=215803 RepID=A0A0C1ZLI4_9BACT|nr:hypothetical protein DB30_03041 [Enhygromyxa salina]
MGRASRRARGPLRCARSCSRRGCRRARGGRSQRGRGGRGRPCGGRRRHRDRRHGWAAAGVRGSRRLLASARRGSGPRHRDSSRALGLARGRRLALALGRLRARRRALRRGLLWHLAARGRAHGPAATLHARADLGGAGGRGLRPARAGWTAGGGVLRGDQLRLSRGPAPPRSRARGPHADGRRAVDHPQPGELRARPARAERRGGHGLLGLADRRASGQRGAARGQLRHRARRRRQLDPLADDLRGPQPRRDAQPRRSVSGLRQPGQRLRPRRGCWRRRARARRASGARGQPRARADQGGGDQPRRADLIVDRTQPRRPDRPPRPCLPRGRRAGRDRGLHRGPRHGHGARRPDRDHGVERGLPSARGRAQRGRGRLRDRLGQEQHRPPRGGRWDRGAVQGRARHAPRDDPREPAHRDPQPHARARRGLRARRFDSGVAGAAGSRGPRAGPPRGRELVRLRRGQRPRGPGTSATSAHAAAQRPSGARRAVGADARGPARDRRALARAPRRLRGRGGAEPGGSRPHAPVRTRRDAPSARAGRRRSRGLGRRAARPPRRPAEPCASRRGRGSTRGAPGWGRGPRRCLGPRGVRRLADDPQRGRAPPRALAELPLRPDSPLGPWGVARARAGERAAAPPNLARRQRLELPRARVSQDAHAPRVLPA